MAKLTGVRIDKSVSGGVITKAWKFSPDFVLYPYLQVQAAREFNSHIKLRNEVATYRR